MDTFTAQLAILVILIFGSILFGSIPSLIGKIIGFYSSSEDGWSRKSKTITFFLYIGAGIFISNTFIILLPQANHEFEKPQNHTHKDNDTVIKQNSSKHSGHHDGFPIPELAVLCGFFLAFSLQEIVCFLLSKFSKTSSEARDLQDRFCTCAKRLTECSRTFKDVRPDQTFYGLEKKLMESGNVPGSAGAASNLLPEAEQTAKTDLLRSSIMSQTIPNYGAVTNAAEPLPVDNPLPVLTPPVLLAEERRLARVQYDETRDQTKFFISSILIVIELSVQYVLLGIHFGLETEHFRNWPYLSIAFLQIFLLTFSAGSYLAAGDMKCYFVGFIISLLSVVSPIGMIVAMLEISSIQKISHSVKGIVLSITCGALLFTTFQEFLRQKRPTSSKRLVKFFALILGASIMAALQYCRLKA